MFKVLLEGLIDTIYPKVCVVCKNKLADKTAIDGIICTDCWSKIKRNLPPFCYSCGRHLEKTHFIKHVCPVCIKQRLHFDRAFSPFAYEGVIKELIHEFKYKNKDYLGRTLSQPMIDFIREYNLPMDDIDFIVPIPLHKAKWREREFNQAAILGNYLAKEFKKGVLNNHLIRHRHTKQQADLEINERFLNVRGVFSVTKPEIIKGGNLLVVDDVLTSGATCSEAAYALKNAGANIVFVLTLAN